VAPLLVPFNRFIGSPDSVREWDEDKPISEYFHTIMGQLFRWLPILQPDGAEMWPLDPSTLLYKGENGLAAPGRPLVVADWDSPPFAMGVSNTAPQSSPFRRVGAPRDAPRGDP
jgi:hypothetical protein